VARKKKKAQERRRKGSGSLTRLSTEQTERTIEGQVMMTTPWLYRGPLVAGQKRVSKVFHAKDRQHAAELLAAWQSNQPKGPVAGSFAEIADQYLGMRRVTGPTMKGYRAQLKYANRIIGNLPIAGVKAEHIDRIISEADLALGSKRGVLTRLSEIFAWALERDMIRKSPIHKSHRERVRPTQTEREQERTALDTAVETTAAKLDAFHEAAWRRDDGTAGGLAASLAMETGMRRGEILHLQVVDFDPEIGDLAVTSGTVKCSCVTCRQHGGIRFTKNRKARRVPLTAQGRAIVEEQLRRLTTDAVPSEWLFPIMRTQPWAKVKPGQIMERGHLYKAFNALCAEVGIERPHYKSAHLGRHVALSRWENNGLTQAQRDLASGHSAQGVRQGYSHANRKLLVAAFTEKMGG
jgi:integrase